LTAIKGDIVNLHAIADGLGRLEQLDTPAGAGAVAVVKTVGKGTLKDLLSGTPIGHPLHPLLTDVPIGAFTAATALDLFGGERAQPGADALVGLGLLSALPTVAAGAADWSDSYGPDQRLGAVHAIANVVGLGLYACSLRARRRDRRGAATVLGLAGMTTMAAGGYLGGHLSHSRGVGVNNAFYQHAPEDWTAVLDDAALAEGETARAACTVTCPWHQSVFRLTDGGVVHGPASVPQVAYDTRVEDGRIEIRVRG
jgi:uncharacterized membrane protein